MFLSLQCIVLYWICASIQRLLHCTPIRSASSARDPKRREQGPSIYDVHTEGEGVRLRWTHVDEGGGGPAPCGRPHRKLKLESTDVILSSSHAKKLASFLPE